MNSSFTYSAFCHTINSRLPLRWLKKSQDTPQFRIEFGIIQPARFQPTGINRLGFELYFGVNESGNVFQWEHLVRMQVSERVLYIQLLQEDSLEFIEQFIVNEGLALLLFEEGHVILHASAVEVRGKAWVFLGESGIGKSTLAAAFSERGNNIISDDLVCLRMKGNRIEVLPSFATVKLWDLNTSFDFIAKRNSSYVVKNITKKCYSMEERFQECPVELGGLFQIYDSGNFYVQELPASESLLMLQRFFPLPSSLLKDEKLESYFYKLNKIAMNHRIGRLTYPNDLLKLNKTVDSMFDMLEENILTVS